MGVDRTAARARALGIAVRLGERFPCLLPNHEGHEARLHPTRKKYWQYKCLRDGQSFGLANVRAFLAYGTVRSIGKTEITRWQSRLDYEAGLISPTFVQIDLPEDAPESVQNVAAGWALLVGLRDPTRWLEEKFTYARNFVVAWTSVTDQQARDGVRALERHNIIRRVGKVRMGLHSPIEYVPATWTDQSSRVFIEEAKRVFPGSYELTKEAA